LRDVADLVARVSQSGGRRWLVADGDAYALAVGLLAALQAGCKAMLPANLQHGHLADLTATADGVISSTETPPGAKKRLPTFDPAPSGDAPSLRSIGPENAEIILHTSGTTGDPVAVPKPLRCLEAEVVDAADRIAWGEFIVIVGDRTPVNQSSRVGWASFLGRPAPFPRPYVLAAILESPVQLIFCLKRAGRYHIIFEEFSKKIAIPRRNPGSMHFALCRPAGTLLRGRSLSMVQIFLLLGQVGTMAANQDSDIGIDLEAVDRADAAHRISQRFFSKSEIRDLAALGPRAPERALMLWALTESIVKANGETVWDGLAKISLAIEGRRIHWSPMEHRDNPNLQLAAGAFRDNGFLALALKSSIPCVFRTYRFGFEPVEELGFEPEFSTYTNLHG